MTRTLITLAALLSFSFGGGLIGGYVGGLHAARGQQGEVQDLRVGLDRVTATTVNMVAALATDTEILAGDLSDLNGRLNTLSVRVKDMAPRN
ncbi:MAG: hypothetical protein OJJ21_06525 [Ferrovibrio sp.]|uniref:hypothetical protein n=1 Tax=Ferrovibrio sp. TaxID=1917215 RepID=UPI0026067654|nr:hypothetical protein [Ferrovibrio sp.]MCW0233233.1 hypothetical protein [Ferrovibrio sp.]